MSDLWLPAVAQPPGYGGCAVSASHLLCEGALQAGSEQQWAAGSRVPLGADLSWLLVWGSSHASVLVTTAAFGGKKQLTTEFYATMRHSHG